MDGLTGKVALVTGAGQGIGRGIALALAGEGVATALVGRTADKLDAVAAEIAARGGRALPIIADVSDAAAVNDAVRAAVATFGRLDILVNNAQEYGFGTIDEMDLGALEAGWRSGAVGAVHCMRAAHPHLAATGGVVINVGSGAAAVGACAGLGGYAAVKAAIAALTRAAAVEWAPDGIRAVTLIPFARTPAVAATLDAVPGLEDRLLAEVPLGRFGDPEADIGRAVVFLASPDAAFITGSTLVVDGGQAFLR
jgi:NAD(P)-dependent dehydrogenase (short-subunit alcohol dehydrogenase family)